MGKLSLQRYNRKRMTKYNNAKGLEKYIVEQQENISFIDKLKEENEKVTQELESVKKESSQILQEKRRQIDLIKGEVLDLKQANYKLKSELENIKIETSHFKDNFKLDFSQKMDEALSSQKNHLNKKHIQILEKYSEDLAEKYRKQFNETSKLCESDTLKLKDQIKMLSLELEATKQALLSAGRRKPVYSPGKYCDNG